MFGWCANVYLYDYNDLQPTSGIALCDAEHLVRHTFGSALHRSSLSAPLHFCIATYTYHKDTKDTKKKTLFVFSVPLWCVPMTIRG